MISRTSLAIVGVALLAACSPGRQEGATPVASAEPPAAAPSAPAEALSAGGFEKTLELQGITFRVACPNDSSINQVTVTPAGLEGDNSPETREVDGSVVGAEVADLNADGSPEVYVFVSSAGSGSYGSLLAFAANDRKSLSEIFLPPLEESEPAVVGYMGHDEFAVVELRLARRFPVYREGDSNAEPSGGLRQLQYRLEPGEAGWVLRLDEALDFEATQPNAG